MGTSKDIGCESASGVIGLALRSDRGDCISYRRAAAQTLPAIGRVGRKYSSY